MILGVLSRLFTSIHSFQVTKTLKGSIELYVGVKKLLNFTPAANSIMRALDTIDKNINDPVNNPNGYTFDPSYVFASFQGIRVFFGFRFNLNK